jgi:hypothetical protein
MGDAGTVFVAGTTEVVAELVQGGLECRDADLRRELRMALAEAKALAGRDARAAREPKPASKAAKEPAAKKPVKKRR